MPIVGDFSCQSSLIGFYQELFPDNRTYLKHEGGLSGYVPPATKPLRHGHYHSIVPQDVCSGFLSITRHLEANCLSIKNAPQQRRGFPHLSDLRILDKIMDSHEAG